MSTNLFEYATRNKLFLASSRGQLGVTELWDVPLRSRDGFDLNSIAKVASKSLKDLAEENFVETAKTASHTRLENALEIVKYIIDVKLSEEAAAKKRADNKVEKEKLLTILAEKQDGKLSALSETELKKRIAALNE